ncbi:indole-3-glycerol phosphate synthase TrpC [Desulfovibrio oxyclinae]|uniref:indole-3-glycerol phosphate synthase TrpC n=1 Tax=Desulfovibrio oxyclinae TaxID=63560 RepID=UPI0003660E86|nr:indole-3-glycerol-phosphate synthase [Desulfovibrio oxyclinae]
MLDKFRKAKQAEIDMLHAEFAQGRIPAAFNGERPSFIDAIRTHGPGAVIAEFKPKSPSKGQLREHANILDTAELYERHGAAAMSVLTEPEYFGGAPEYLFMARQTCRLPLLRKDFILDPLQIAQTASTPASAVLLIARMFETSAELRDMVRLAKSAGLTPVVEVFDEADLKHSREAEADVIQVNNRDLGTLTTTLDISRRLVQDKAEGELWISASGVDTRKQVEEVATMGFDAVLVGTSLMLAEAPGAKLDYLTGAVE